jgi:hypothetical protein
MMAGMQASIQQITAAKYGQVVSYQPMPSPYSAATPTITTLSQLTSVQSYYDCIYYGDPTMDPPHSD